MINYLKSIKINMRNLLACICVLGVFVMLFILIKKPIPQENSQIIHMAIGQILTVAFAMVYGYFFGTTKTENDIKELDIKLKSPPNDATQTN